MYKIRGGDGKEYGPVTAEQIQQWVRENRLNGQSMTQAAGATEWKPLATFPEFAALFAGAPAPTTPPPLPASPAPAAVSTPRPTPRAEIPTYLVPAILCTLLCCLPFGVPAIVYAAQVSSKQTAGDIAGAEIASRNARTWCWVAFGVGIIWAIVVFVAMGATFAKSGGQPRLF